MKKYNSAIIIDDDPDLCMLLKAMLNKYIAEIRFAHTIRGGEQLLKTFGSDIVFLDNNLPDGKGVMYIKELKTIQPTAMIIVISAMAGLKTLALENGADNFVEKPLTESSIKNALGLMGNEMSQG